MHRTPRAPEDLFPRHSWGREITETGSGSRYESGGRFCGEGEKEEGCSSYLWHLGHSECLKQRRDLGGALQPKRSCLGWARFRPYPASGAHVTQSRGPVSPDSLPGLPLFQVDFALWCIHIPDTHIPESSALTGNGMYVCVYENVPVHPCGDCLARSPQLVSP